MNAIVQTMILDAVLGGILMVAVLVGVAWGLWVIGLFDLEDGQ